MTGETIKTLAQFSRARKLADAIIKVGSSRAELEDAITKRPETDYWGQLAVMAGITPPSETTQQLTLSLLMDRECEAEKMDAHYAKLRKSIAKEAAAKCRERSRKF